MQLTGLQRFGHDLMTQQQHIDIPHVVYLSACQLADIDSTFELLWIMLLWISVYKFFCDYIVYFQFLGVYNISRKELLGHMVTLCGGTM